MALGVLFIATEMIFAMTGRAEQKAQLRADREAREQAQVEARVRRQRLFMAGGVIIVAVVVAVVAIAISSHPRTGPVVSPATAPESATAKASDARVARLLTGVPQQQGMMLGDANAPATIIEYGDLECSACDDFALSPAVNTSDGTPGSGVLDQIITGLVRTQKAKLEYRSLETATGVGATPNEFVPQQAAAYAAGEQKRGWTYIELFYNEQGQEGTSYVNDAYLTGLAMQIRGLDLTEWNADRNSRTLKSRVASDNSEGTTLGQASGGADTPTIYVQGRSGKPQRVAESIPTYAQVAAAVKSVS